MLGGEINEGFLFRALDAPAVRAEAKTVGYDCLFPVVQPVKCFVEGFLLQHSEIHPVGL